MKLELTLLSGMHLQTLPPEYKTEELRNLLDLMWRVSRYDLVELGSAQKTLGKMMLESDIAWNDKKHCYYVSGAVMLNKYNYNRMSYIAIGPNKRAITAKINSPFDRASLDECISENFKIMQRKSKAIVCSQDDTSLLELRGPFVKMLVKPEEERYNESLDAAVEVITGIHSGGLAMSVPNISLNQYLLGFFLHIPEYSITRGIVREVLSNFYLFLNKGIESAVLFEKNFSASQFYHDAQDQGCKVVSRDLTPRHIKYFYSDKDKNLIIGFNASVDIATIEKKLENPVKVSINNGDWMNKEELDYDELSRKMMSQQVKEIKLQGTRLLRNTQYASINLEYDSVNRIIREKGSNADLIRINHTSITIPAGLENMERTLAFEIANEFYDQLLLITPFVGVGRRKSGLLNDERSIIKNITERASGYVEQIRGATPEYARILAQKDMLTEMIKKSQQKQ